MKKIILIFVLVLIVFFVLCFFYKESKKETNIFLKINKYEEKNKKRYYEYYNKNKKMSLKKIVLNVNMNLDIKEYQNIKTITNPNMLSLVNKHYKLKSNYNPYNLITIKKEYTNKTIQVKDIMIRNLYKMIDDMIKENLEPIIVSGYRTNEYQTKLYNNYKLKDKFADKYSARPGHSEHELGVSIDITKKNHSLNSFEKTNEFIWLKYNSYKYGFILRYPKDKENITKYIYEPWHYRYIGKKHAKKIHKLNLTYEEYYELYIKI